MPGVESWRDTLPQTISSVVSNQSTIVNLVGDVEPPLCFIISPEDNEKVSGQVTITLDVSDNQGISDVLLYVGDSVVDAVSYEIDGDPPHVQERLELQWSSVNQISGVQTVTVEVYDLAGNMTRSSVNVIVENSGSFS